MKKNVAGQKVGCQMNSATDGSAFTGTVTVYVTLDAGTQAVGTVGSGVCTHEGNGYHTYAPSQAETNGDLAAFTFTGSGAIPATVQIYTGFPQTGDVYGALPSGFTATTFPSGTVASTTNITAGTITTVTNLTNLPAITTNWLTASGIAAGALNGKGDWNIGKTGYSLTQSFPTNFSALAITAGGAVTAGTVSDKTGYALTSGERDSIAAALLDLTDGVETSWTVRKALRIQLSALGGKASGLATTTARYRDMADSKDRIVATVDADGNRTAVTLDAT